MGSKITRKNFWIVFVFFGVPAIITLLDKDYLTAGVIGAFCGVSLVIIFFINLIEKRISTRNARQVAMLRSKVNCIARYMWVRSRDDKSKENHTKLSPEEEASFDDETQFIKDRASIELFEGGKAIYLYTYGINGEYYEWECKYKISEKELLLIPYFYKRGYANRKRCEVFATNDKGLKYLGNRALNSKEKPKRDLPYSRYTNFIKV